MSEEKVGEERGDYIEERHEERKLNISKKKKRRRNGGEKVIWTSEINKIEVKKKTDNIKEWKREENIVNKYINKMSEKIMTGKNERNH